MFFRKKVFTPFAAVILSVIICAFSVSGTWFAIRKTVNSDLCTNDLYSLAMRDAVFADKDEIMPLVEIDKESDMVTWNETGDRVLMLTLHKYPESYPEGSEVTLKWGEVWTFTDKEIIKWYRENKEGVTDWDLRLNQLLGMPADSGETHVTAMWVTPESLIRPGYETDIASQVDNAFDEEHPESESYTEWFNENIVYSYFDSAYPWTRLGYTYDWADNGKEYGLSEFLIQNGADVEVEFTKTLGEFISWIEKQ